MGVNSKIAKVANRKVTTTLSDPLVTVWYDATGRKHKTVDTTRTNAAWRRGEYEGLVVGDYLAEREN